MTDSLVVVVVDANAAGTLYAARCWRCDEQMFRIRLEPDREIPPGVAIERKCRKCKAFNRIPLDNLASAAVG